MNRVKKISSVIMVLALVLCTGYLSMMSPTTAWLYQSQSVSGTNNKFVFADLDVDRDYSFDKSIVFDGATAFKDENETLFDEVVQVVDIDVENEGGMPARIYSTVKNSTQAKGLRYFYYTDDMLVNNSVKETIANALNYNLTDAALNNYNIGVDGNSGKYIMINPGERKTVKVALWVEYDESGVQAAFEESGWNSIDYRITISMTATQDVDGAMVR